MLIPGAKLRDARLAYVTPAHQFPTGVVMSLPRRLALLDWARSCGALIFEDDYDSEYRYRGRPIPALQGLDRYGQVLFSGSFSKVLFPSLRLGYLVLPLDLVDRFAAAMSVRRRHLPVLEQLVVRDFIVDGHFGRHLRRMREIYAERLSVLLESATEHLEGVLEISSVEAGLQTTGWLAPGIDAKAVARAAAVRRVEVIPLDVYARGRAGRPGLQLGFAAVEPSEIAAACASSRRFFGPSRSGQFRGGYLSQAPFPATWTASMALQTNVAMPAENPMANSTLRRNNSFSVS